MSDYDLIIKGGTLIDGSGAAPVHCDVAINGDRIVSLAPPAGATADRVIDASGRYVTPGFVDVHTHYDGQATWEERLQPSSNLGATTVVMGNCGVGFAPCRDEDHQTLIELMEGVEEIPGTALAEGLPWTWESFPEYLSVLDAQARDIDVAALYPHGPLRVFVMGERGVNREPATEKDIAQMKALLQEGLEAGAVGFSTSRTLAHRSVSGERVPTYDAAREELVELGSSLSGDKGHVFQLISDWDDADAEFDILRRASAKSGARGTFSLLDLYDKEADGTPLWRGQLKRLEAAQAEGLDIQGQVLSRPVGMLMGHISSMNPFYKRPSYEELSGLSHEERIEALRDPARKARILQEENVKPHLFVKIFVKRYELMFPVGDDIEYIPERDASVKHRAEAEGRDPQEWLYDFLLGNEGENFVFIPASNYSDAVPELLQHPFTVPALGDGGAHVGSICDTSAQLYLLTKWVRESKHLELAAAVNLLTRKPAEMYSLLDRGLIAEGMLADINIIDLETLKLHRPHIVHDLPAGGSRLIQFADGLSATIKAGELIYENGNHTGALPGKLLRGAQADPRKAA